MKQLVLILAIIAFIVTPALANDFDDLQWGSKRLSIEQPYAVQIMNTPAYLGWEVSKEVSSTQTFRDGFSAVAKITLTNTFFGRSPWTLKKSIE